MPSFAEELAALALEHFCRVPGAMYGAAAGLNIGAGIICRNVRYASFDPDSDGFRALKGMVLVLTHECDLDQNNTRDYNSHFVGIPLIFLNEFASLYDNAALRERAKSFIVAIASGNVSRLYYLPPVTSFLHVPELKLGALVYLNALTSHHLNQLSGNANDKACALSEYGLQFSDLMLERHLRRPKAQQLPVTC